MGDVVPLPFAETGPVVVPPPAPPPLPRADLGVEVYSLEFME